MEICRQDQALEIRELDPFLAELLRQVPESVQPGMRLSVTLSSQSHRYNTSCCQETPPEVVAGG